MTTTTMTSGTSAKTTEHGLGPHSGGVAVELVSCRRTFGKVHALDGFSISIAPGELVALFQGTAYIKDEPFPPAP